jgi:hypothetical protein
MERRRRCGKDVLHDWSAHQHDSRGRDGRTNGLATDTVLALPGMFWIMIRTGVFRPQPGGRQAGVMLHARMLHGGMVHAGVMTRVGSPGHQLRRLQQRTGGIHHAHAGITLQDYSKAQQAYGE